MANGFGAYDRVMAGNPPRTEAQVIAERAVNALRSPRLSGSLVDVRWTWPGSNSVLILEVDHDQFGGRYLNEVRDERGHSFPLEAIELNGKPLEDVLVEYVRGLPDLEREGQS